MTTLHQQSPLQSHTCNTDLQKAWYRVVGCTTWLHTVYGMYANAAMLRVGVPCFVVPYSVLWVCLQVEMEAMNTASSSINKLSRELEVRAFGRKSACLLTLTSMFVCAVYPKLVCLCTNLMCETFNYKYIACVCRLGLAKHNVT